MNAPKRSAYVGGPCCHDLVHGQTDLWENLGLNAIGIIQVELNKLLEG